MASGPGAITHISCSPDGGTLVFQADQGGRSTLWTVPASGGTPHPLTAQEGRRPVWSPDGKWVAFASPQAGNWDICIVPAAGGQPTRVTRNPGADWSPCWSPDGKRIAFLSNRDSVAIWVTPVGQDRAVRIGRAGGVNPAWSPDGKRIAFRILSKEGADICVMPADGGPSRRLTINAGADAPPVWSPDGKRIAFLSYAAYTSVAVTPADGGKGQTLIAGLTQPVSLTWLPDGSRLLFCAKSSDLWTVPAGGGAPSRLTNDLFDDRKPDPDGGRIVFESNRDGTPGLWTLDTAGAPRLLLPHSVADAHPRYSPDGKQIAFASSRGAGGRQTDLWTVSADGSNARRMTNLGGLKGRPTWFTDNARIIFESDLNGGWGLWALESGGIIKPIPIQKPSMRPAWSPDGWWLAYQSQRNDNWDIYLTQMKTGLERRLTTDPAFESDPAWSRDGGRIAFASNRSGSDNLYVIPTSGEGSEKAITSGPDDDIEPAWFPDGSRIVFVRIERQSIWSVTAP